MALVVKIKKRNVTPRRWFRFWYNSSKEISEVLDASHATDWNSVADAKNDVVAFGMTDADVDYVSFNEVT